MDDLFIKVAGDMIYAALLFLCGVMASYLRDSKKERRAIEKGLCAILRNDIIMIHNDATKNKQIPYTQSQNVNHMYEAYKELGGNGVIDTMMQEIGDLPVITIQRGA